MLTAATLDPAAVIAAAGAELYDAVQELLNRTRPDADGTPAFLDELTGLLRRARGKVSRATKRAAADAQPVTTPVPAEPAKTLPSFTAPDGCGCQLRQGMATPTPSTVDCPVDNQQEGVGTATERGGNSGRAASGGSTQPAPGKRTPNETATGQAVTRAVSAAIPQRSVRRDQPGTQGASMSQPFNPQPKPRPAVQAKPTKRRRLWLGIVGLAVLAVILISTIVRIASGNSSELEVSTGGLTAEQVAGELNSVFPAPNARNNTGACAGDGGCVQLVTTDAVSIYQWPDEATARRHASAANDAREMRQIGPFVLSWDNRDGRQGVTSASARDAYAARLAELVAAEH